jgi:hypothetical protein
MYTFISEFCYELTWLLGGFMMGIAASILCNVIGDITSERKRKHKRHKAGKHTQVITIDGTDEVLITGNKHDAKRVK